MWKKYFAVAAVVGILLTLGTTLAFAQQTTSGGLTLPNPLGASCSDANCVVTKVVQFLVTAALSIAVLMVLVGAFQMITAGGDPEKFSKGRKTIMYAAIGVVVVIISGGVVQIIQSLFK